MPRAWKASVPWDQGSCGLASIITDARKFSSTHFLFVLTYIYAAIGPIDGLSGDGKTELTNSANELIKSTGEWIWNSSCHLLDYVTQVSTVRPIWLEIAGHFGLQEH